MQYVRQGRSGNAMQIIPRVDDVELFPEAEYDSKSDPCIASHGVSLRPSHKTRVMYHHMEDLSTNPKFILHSMNHSVL